MRPLSRAAALLVVTATLANAQSPGLPAGLEAPTREALEQIIDSARALGLPVQPLYAKAAEGRLKQAADAQIIGAVRGLANRFREIRASVASPMDVATMTAAATALSAGVPLAAIRDMRDAATGARNPDADLAGALVAVTDLVAQRVSTASAVSAVQSLLARRADPEQYARLRAGVGDFIAAGRSPDQAVRSTTETIVRTLPPAPATSSPIRPPLGGDAPGDSQVSKAPTTSRNPR